MLARKRKRKPGVERKRYRNEFLWAQLVGWFKQTVYDPTASLQADRRGCVILPIVENCYAESVLDGTYLEKQRPRMYRIMAQRIEAQWPTGLIWSYRNQERVYGTPMLDVAIERVFNDPQVGSRLKTMLCRFKSAFPSEIQPSPSDQNSERH